MRSHAVLRGGVRVVEDFDNIVSRCTYRSVTGGPPSNSAQNVCPLPWPPNSEITLKDAPTPWRTQGC